MHVVKEEGERGERERRGRGKQEKPHRFESRANSAKRTA